MKVLALNGSCHREGNTYTALAEMGKVFAQAGVDFELFQIGSEPLRDCIGCRKCSPEGCVFTDDAVNEFVAKAKEADGLVFGTPVYYAHPSGRVLSFLDRVFYSSSASFANKVGASVAVARRAGTSASFDVMNKYFGISKMVVAGSSYWNLTFGGSGQEVLEDGEGMQTVRNLARNMTWLMQCIEAGKQNGVALPEYESGARTNFIR